MVATRALFAIVNLSHLLKHGLFCNEFDSKTLQNRPFSLQNALLSLQFALFSLQFALFCNEFALKTLQNGPFCSVFAPKIKNNYYELRGLVPETTRSNSLS